MATAVIYDGVIAQSQNNISSNNTGLFAGQQLWFSHTVPQRQWLIQNAQANGATVTEIDSQAEIILYDHARKNVPPGAISYRYVERSIRNGVLERVEDHRITSDSRAARPVGSNRTAPKGTRTGFTDADDQLLWDWMKPYIDNGGTWKGNEIYRQLEIFNPRHTYQSWRDRWIKHTQYQKREITTVFDNNQRDNVPQDEEQRSPKRRRVERTRTNSSSNGPVRRETGEKANDSVNNPHLEKALSSAEYSGRKNEVEAKITAYEAQESTSPRLDGFTREETQLLFQAAPEILKTNPEFLDQSWNNLALSRTAHSKDAWRAFFEIVIIPEYKKRKGLDTEEKFDRHVMELRIQGSNEDEHNSLSRNDTPETRSGDEGAIGQLPAQPKVDLDTLPFDNEAKEDKLRLSQRHPALNQLDGSGQERNARSRHVAGPHHSSSQPPISSQSSQGDDFLPDIPHRRDSQSDGGVPLLRSDQADIITMSGVNLYNLPIDPVSTHAEQGHAIDHPDTEEELVAWIPESHKTLQEQVLFDDQKHQRMLSNLRRSNNESPMFVSEDSSQSVLGMVELVEEGLPVSQHDDHDSDYAPSEAASLADFLDTPDLSIGWDTAPEQQDLDMDLDEADRTESRHNSKLSSLSSASAITAIEGSDIAHLETTSTYPVHQPHSPTTHNFVSPPQEAMQFESVKANHLNTDLMLEQQMYLEIGKDIPTSDRTKTGIRIADERDNESGDAMFMVPVPEGGWSDDEEDVEITSEQLVSHSEPIIAEKSRQGKSPEKQNVQTLIRHTTPENEDDEVQTWLASQTSLYVDIHPLVREAICIKSLEATSIQLETTSELVKLLIVLYKKGKHPAMAHLIPFVKDLTSSKVKRRRSSRSFYQAISRTIDEMMPTNQQGVWTKLDDEKLTGTNARGVQEVEHKHGENGVRLRFEYLEQLYKNE